MVNVLPLIGSLVFASAGAANATSFTPIGLPPSAAYGVSPDGSVVVGEQNGEIFRWTRNRELKILPRAPEQRSGVGTFTSRDGSRVIGIASTSGGQRGFLWKEGEGSLAYTDGLVNTAFTGASADGTRITGFSSSAQQSSGFLFYPDIRVAVALRGFEDWPNANPRGISEDGSVIVGSCFQYLESRATVWYGSPVFVGRNLGLLPGQRESAATAVSGDGKVVVGTSGSRAFRWTEATGMQDIGAASPTSVSHDGSRVLFLDSLWDSAHGMRHLQTLLTDEYGLGAALKDWRLTAARAISSDGLTIVGQGINPQGFTQGWRVRLTPEVILHTPRVAGSNFLFDVTGLAPGNIWVLQSSSNFTTWTSIQTNAASGGALTLTNSRTSMAEVFRLHHIE